VQQHRYDQKWRFRKTIPFILLRHSLADAEEKKITEENKSFE
jgi:hypothetical protein